MDAPKRSPKPKSSTIIFDGNMNKTHSSFYKTNPGKWKAYKHERREKTKTRSESALGLSKNTDPLR